MTPSSLKILTMAEAFVQNVVRFFRRVKEVPVSLTLLVEPVLHFTQLAQRVPTAIGCG